MPLGEVRVATVERVGDHETEDGVPEKLQPLVRREIAVLVRIGTVRQRPHQQAPADLYAEAFLELNGIDRDFARCLGTHDVRRRRIRDP
jgi:hypothetical protein